MNEKERQEWHETEKEELQGFRERLKDSNLSEEEWRILDRKEDKLIAEGLRLSLDLDSESNSELVSQVKEGVSVISDVLKH
jgi:hypothetical protein